MGHRHVLYGNQHIYRDRLRRSLHIPPDSKLPSRTRSPQREAPAVVHVGRVMPDVILATRELLSLSDDELQLVHEAIPGDALFGVACGVANASGPRRWPAVGLRMLQHLLAILHQ